MRRWLAVLIACGGLAAACSSVGPLDGAGGSGGLPTSTGGSGVGGTGGFLGTVAVSQLSCLKTLFAACPTDVGVCGLDVGGQGLGGQAGSGGSFGAVYCFASGITVATQTQTSACPAEFTGTWDTEWEVHKPDGSVCYTYSRRRDCGDEAEVFTIRDRSGAIVGSGMSSVVASPQATRWFTCANGDSCQGDYCEPFVPLPNDGCAAAVCP